MGSHRGLSLSFGWLHNAEELTQISGYEVYWFFWELRMLVLDPGSIETLQQAWSICWLDPNP